MLLQMAMIWRWQEGKQTEGVAWWLVSVFSVMWEMYLIENEGGGIVGRIRKVKVVTLKTEERIRTTTIKNTKGI